MNLSILPSGGSSMWNGVGTLVCVFIHAGKKNIQYMHVWAYVTHCYFCAHSYTRAHALTLLRLALWIFSKRIIDECSFSELLIACFYSITSLELLNLTERKRQIGFAECAKALLQWAGLGCGVQTLHFTFLFLWLLSRRIQREMIWVG